MSRLPAYILAGGRSSRLGTDKARVELGGSPLIVRVARRLAPHAESLKVVAASADSYADLGLETIADVEPHLGPMGGLRTALRDLDRDAAWLLLAACDLVEIRSRWIDALRAARSGGAAAVAFRGDRWQPLLALYHRSVLGPVEARVANGELAMQRLLDAVDTVALALPGDWPEPSQINDAQDLRRAGGGGMSVEGRE